MICDAILAVVVMGLGGFVLSVASKWPDYSRLSVLGPDMIPRYMGWFFIIMGVALLAGVAYKLFVKKTDAQGDSLASAEREKAAASLTNLKKRWKNALAVVLLPALMWLFAYLLKPVGFEICSVVFVFLALLICQERRWYNLVFVSLGVPAAIYVVFCLLLNVTIPLRFL